MAPVTHALLRDLIHRPIAAAFSANGGNEAKVYMAITELLTKIAKIRSKQDPVESGQDSEELCQALELLGAESLRLRNCIRELSIT